MVHLGTKLDHFKNIFNLKFLVVSIGTFLSNPGCFFCQINAPGEQVGV